MEKISKSNFNNLSEKITGGSPPSAFVTLRISKSKSRTSIFTIANRFDNTDHPEKWAGKSIDDIIRYKLSLIRGTHSTHVKTNLNADRYIQSLQELTMATRSTEIEVAFERKPKLNLEEISSGTSSDSTRSNSV